LPNWVWWQGVFEKSISQIPEEKTGNSFFLIFCPGVAAYQCGKRGVREDFSKKGFKATISEPLLSFDSLIWQEFLGKNCGNCSGHERLLQRNWRMEFELIYKCRVDQVDWSIDLILSFEEKTKEGRKEEREEGRKEGFGFFSNSQNERSNVRGSKGHLKKTSPIFSIFENSVTGENFLKIINQSNTFAQKCLLRNDNSESIRPFNWEKTALPYLSFYSVSNEKSEATAHHAFLTNVKPDHTSTHFAQWSHRQRRQKVANSIWSPCL
jgi:hypothetical protein